GQEQPAAAVHVGKPPADQHEAGEDEDVAADDPLETGNRQVQVTLDGRQRDIDDVVVSQAPLATPGLTCGYTRTTLIISGTDLVLLVLPSYSERHEGLGRQPGIRSTRLA